MRYISIFVFLTCSILLQSQDEKAKFDNEIELKEGIYTSFNEIIENDPKYYNCTVGVIADFGFGGMLKGMIIYYYDELGIKYELQDTILLIIQDGEKYIRFHDSFYKLMLAGAISTFTIERQVHNYSTGYSESYENLFFLDLQTGVIEKLNPINIDKIIKRDNELYFNYSALSNSKKRKTLYSYVLKYNMRNPIYINME